MPMAEEYDLGELETTEVFATPPRVTSPADTTHAHEEAHTAADDAARAATVGAMGAIDFTAPQPFNDRLMVLAGISSDPHAMIVNKTFAFQINPQRLQRTQHKNQSIVWLGREGDHAVDPAFSPAEYRYQSLQYEQFTYNGVTPSFNPLRNGGRTQLNESPWGDYSQTPGYQWLRDFEDFYREFCNRMIFMRFANCIYVGMLDDFGYTRNAAGPFNISYQFVFRSVYTYDLAVGKSSFVPGAGRMGQGMMVQQIIAMPRTAPMGMLGRNQDDLTQQFMNPSPTLGPSGVDLATFKSYVETQRETDPQQTASPQPGGTEPTTKAKKGDIMKSLGR